MPAAAAVQHLANADPTPGDGDAHRGGLVPVAVGAQVAPVEPGFGVVAGCDLRDPSRIVPLEYTAPLPTAGMQGFVRDDMTPTGVNA
jgi:hypothetical protein